MTYLHLKVPREGFRTEVLIFPQILLIFSYWMNVLKLDILLPASLLNSPMCFYLQQKTYLLSMPTYLQYLLLNIQLHSSPLYSFRLEYKSPSGPLCVFYSWFGYLTLLGNGKNWGNPQSRRRDRQIKDYFNVEKVSVIIFHKFHHKLCFWSAKIQC